MTRQEHFKKRVRARMAKTGERYAAARRALLDQAQARTGRAWVSEPEMSDDAIRAGTGKGWDEWCDVIEAWPGHTQGRTAVAKWLHAETDLSGWWSQGVTNGWERIMGTGVVLMSVAATGDDRAKVTVSHEKLATAAEVDEWKFWWGEWLDALDG